MDEDILKRLSPFVLDCKIYLTSITINQMPNYSKESESGNTSLVIYGLNEAEAKRIALTKTSQTSWVYKGCIELPSNSTGDDIKIILNSDEIGDMGDLLFKRSYLGGLALKPLGSCINFLQSMSNVKDWQKLVLSTDFYILPANKIAAQPRDSWDDIFTHPEFQATLDECQDVSYALCKHSSFLHNLFQYNGNIQEISRAINSQEKAIQLTPENHLNMIVRLNNLGIYLLDRFDHTGHLRDNSEATSAFRKAVQLTPDGDSDMPSRLNNLGDSLLGRFEHTGNLSDISEAISTLRKSVQLTPNGHSDMPSRLKTLGDSLADRFKCTGDLSDISEAISFHQKAVQLTPDGHSDIPPLLTSLGGSLIHRFQRTGDLSDISEAISLRRKAVQLTPDEHSDMPLLLANLGGSLTHRFERTGDLSDISEAISILQKAVQVTPELHSNMPSMLNNLGASLTGRFERTGDISDISEAISLHRKALGLMPEGHTNMPSRLNSLGVSLTQHFERTGDLADISEAISLLRKAIQLTADSHSSMASRLSNLGALLTSRFKHTGDLLDISESITVHRKAVMLTPDGHYEMPSQLTNLGASLAGRFDYTGDLLDISESITVHRKAVMLTPDGHSDMHSRLNNLSMSLMRRFNHAGDLPDISEAISILQKAVQLTPDVHSDMASQLNNLGTLLIRRFERTGDLSDNSEAITLLHRAIKLTPEGHSSIPSRLNTLSSSLADRFERTRDPSDISEVISLRRKALQLTPDGHSDIPSRLHNLGASLTSRFEYAGDPSDSAEAISLCRKGIKLTPDNHSDKSSQLSNLGSAFLSCFEQHRRPIDLEEASSNFRLAAINPTGSPSIRLNCARQWAWCSRRFDPLQSLDAYEIAIQLVSQIAGMDQTFNARHRHLQDVSDLSLDAAATAFYLGRPDKALEWLEQGRCIVWNQLNNLRTPLDALRSYDPALADEILKVSRALENAGSRSNIAIDSTMDKRINLDEEAHSHVKLVREWKRLLDKVRAYKDFKTFLKPSSCSTLLEQLPPSGLVVMINTHKESCDALILIAGRGEPLHVPLRDFSYERAEELRNELRKTLTSHRLRMRGDENEDGADRAMRRKHNEKSGANVPMQKILYTLWMRVVKPILEGAGYSSPPADSMLSRIWWCATGALAFLPLHAAGIYGAKADLASNISSFAISSYTPTVTSLIQRVKNLRKSDAARVGVFMAAVPDAPGLSYIPGTTEEVNAIDLQLQKFGIRCLRLNGKSATKDLAMENMTTHSCVHFACHAIQDTAEPLRSGFYFHDDKLELSAIVKKNLDGADLAFLSACQTSTGNEKLSEEAVHLAAGMLAAGYRSVIATMWSIQDRYGPVIAENVYKHLLERGARDGGKGINGSDGAYALHYAVQEIRKTIGDSEASLLAWVPYVHFGF